MSNSPPNGQKMDFSSTCRTCLCDGALNPIFENPDDYRRYSSALLMVAGIKVEINDGLPQKMCTNCVNKLNNSLKFRKQCNDVQSQLLQMKKDLQLSEIVIAKIKHEDEDIKDEIVMKSDITLICNVETDCGIKEENDICEFQVNDDDDKPLTYLIEDVTTYKPKTLNYVTEKEIAEYSMIPEKEEEIKKNKLSKKRIKTTEPPYRESIQLTEQEIAECSMIPEREEEIKREGKKKKLSTKKIKTTDPPYRESYRTDTVKLRVTCNICHKDLSIRSIDNHMSRMHPGADGRKRKCDLCDAFLFADKMPRHVAMMHGDSGFRCGYCKTEFESRESLVQHVTSCNSKTKKRKNEAGRQLQECDICNKIMQKASLRMHKAIKHAGLGPVCEHCGIKFGNKFRLNDHYRAKHGYEKFKCSYCDFQSSGTMAMRNHERRHRGEKPFVCEACGAKFHAAYLLAQHRQSHRTERPVKCDRCPARFKARNSLHAHRRARHARRRRRRSQDETIKELNDLLAFYLHTYSWHESIAMTVILRTCKKEDFLSKLVSAH